MPKKLLKQIGKCVSDTTDPVLQLEPQIKKQALRLTKVRNSVYQDEAVPGTVHVSEHYAHATYPVKILFKLYILICSVTERMSPSLVVKMPPVDPKSGKCC